MGFGPNDFTTNQQHHGNVLCTWQFTCLATPAIDSYIVTFMSCQLQPDMIRCCCGLYIAISQSTVTTVRCSSFSRINVAPESLHVYLNLHLPGGRCWRLSEVILSTNTPLTHSGSISMGRSPPWEHTQPINASAVRVPWSVPQFFSGLRHCPPPITAPMPDSGRSLGVGSHICFRIEATAFPEDFRGFSSGMEHRNWNVGTSGTIRNTRA